jgi:type II secretory pathway pseudopilin PulG
MKKQSFTMVELIIVIVVISILVIKSNFILSDTSLNQAADQVLSNINYTRELAINDNKFQYYPINNSAIEMNRTKYWFKQWWQIRFSKSGDDYWYEIFSDVPDDTPSQNFDGYGKNPIDQRSNSWAILNDKYLVGYCGDSAGNYPQCKDVDERLNLSKYYGIKKIVYRNFASSKRLLFDNYGNVYISEGESGDNGDINPYDKDERKPLTQIVKISLCKDNNCEKNISICIMPKTGFAYICK